MKFDPRFPFDWHQKKTPNLDFPTFPSVSRARVIADTTESTLEMTSQKEFTSPNITGKNSKVDPVNCCGGDCDSKIKKLQLMSSH